MSVLSANLAALRARQPALADRLAAAAPLPADDLAVGPAGGRSVRRPGPDGRPLWLHSRHDPAREAARQIAALNLGPADTVCVIGAGLGHHVAALWAAAPAPATTAPAPPARPVFLFERDPALLAAAFAEHDFSAPLAAGRLHVFLPADEHEVAALLADHWVTLFTAPLCLWSHPASARAAPAFDALVRAGVAAAMESGEVLLRSALLTATRQYRNLLGNLPAYLAAPPVAEFAGAGAGRPGLLIGAGPSLASALPVLAGRTAGATVVAVSTALKPALAAGVVPDWTVCVDFHRLSVRYFADVAEAPGIRLLADPLAHWEAVAAWDGPVVMPDHETLNRLLGRPAAWKGALEVGASVAEAGFALLEYLGADPIVLVGVDLCYTAGVTHVPGAASAREWRGELHRFHTLEMRELERLLRNRDNLFTVDDVAGRPVRTNGEMRSYLQQLGARCARFAGRVVNVSRLGARIPHTETAGLDALPALLGAGRQTAEDGRGARAPSLAPLPTRSPQPAALSPSAAAARLADHRRRLTGLTERLTRALAAAEELGWHLAAEGTPDPAAARDVAAGMAPAPGEEALWELLRDLARAAEFQRLKEQRRLDARPPAPGERAHAELARDRNYVAGLAAAAETLDDLLAHGCARLAAGGEPEA